jgi:3-hydroxyacyl-CoA dehydrogenase / enoyl-CoA hydratase / 3-hydroxybutyryl-CoA epimerase
VTVLGVVGAGTMGAGIAQLGAAAGMRTLLHDPVPEALEHGAENVRLGLGKWIEKGRIGQDATSLLEPVSRLDDLSPCELVIEAAPERADLKRDLFGALSMVCGDDVVLATNTSSIPVTSLAGAAARPENVVGMHFFNPVDRMPLVEVIRGAKTSDAAMVTVASFARKLGKTVVYCNDGPGFVVNRILGPYMNESGFLLEEGNSIESLDKAMIDFGMPMGPMALLDEVGIDVASKVAVILGDAFGARMERSSVVEKLYKDGRYGKKNGKGLYVYKDGKRQGPDASVYKVIGVSSPHPADARAVVERMTLAMINEAALILDEKIVATAGELDLAMIMGTGFPPFRGGLLRYADSLGLPYILARLDGLTKLGTRFVATEPLRRLAESGKKYYEAYAR